MEEFYALAMTDVSLPTPATLPLILAEHGCEETR
jgi:hypothetical protein